MIFFCSLVQTHILGAQKNRLTETALSNTHYVSWMKISILEACSITNNCEDSRIITPGPFKEHIKCNKHIKTINKTEKNTHALIYIGPDK